MKRPSSPDTYSDSEIEKRMEDGLRRALTTPHKPNASLVGKARKAAKSKASAKRVAKPKAR